MKKYNKNMCNTSDYKVKELHSFCMNVQNIVQGVCKVHSIKNMWNVQR